MNLIEALSVFGITTISGETQTSLKQKYRVFAKQRHPDRTGGGSEEFIALQEAYVLLKKELKDIPNDSVDTNHDEPSLTPKKTSFKGRVVVDEDEVKKRDEKPEVSIASTNELKTLSKDELLEKYYHDTTDLQERIGTLISSHELHRTVLEDVEAQVNSLSSEYRQQMNQLQTVYQKKIDKLEKNPMYRFWIKFFVTPVTGKDLWHQYQNNIEVYKTEKEKVRSSFNERLLEIYGESLNEMSKYLTKDE
jgi:curved DNA-binding protein CbpA